LRAVSSPADARLVIFDIDGTLLATDAFWLDVGRRAVSTVYARHGVRRELPADERFLGAIGLPMVEFWRHVLPHELHGLGDEVEREAEDLEEAAFAQGLGAMYPGARRLLDDLHREGRELALASNCSRRYLDAFVRSFDLAKILLAARCADDPGIRSKGDMVAEILAAAGHRRAIVIGDRESDRDAARGNRLPFVLFTGGFSATRPSDGDVVAEDYAALRRILSPG
jgi:HAD superfamily hydrolase (TIGR01549 family)